MGWTSVVQRVECTGEEPGNEAILVHRMGYVEQLDNCRPEDGVQQMTAHLYTAKLMPRFGTLFRHAFVVQLQRQQEGFLRESGGFF